MTDEAHKEATLGAKKVRSYILAHPGCTSREVIKATGLDPAALGALVGLITQRVRNDKAKGWWATAAAKEVRRASAETVEAHMERSLGAVHRAVGGADVEQSTPLSELISKDSEVCVDEATFGRLMKELGLEDRASLEGVRSVADIQAETLRWFLIWIFERGFDPRIVVQRVFSGAKEFTPGVLKDMPDEALSVLLLDGGRATVNARTQLIARGLRAGTGLKTAIGTHHKRKTNL